MIMRLWCKLSLPLLKFEIYYSRSSKLRAREAARLLAIKAKVMTTEESSGRQINGTQSDNLRRTLARRNLNEGRGNCASSSQ
jgi:hypothetical protein